MFQNISRDDYEQNTQEYEDVEYKQENKYQKLIKKILSKQNIALYVIAFMVSQVSFMQGIAPFGIAFLASLCSNYIPMGILYTITLIGTFVGFGTSGLLNYVLTSLVFIAITLLVKPKYIYEERNEKRKLAIPLFCSVLFVQLVQLLFKGVIVYDILVAILLTITTCVFYKIFSNSISVIKDYGQKVAFTIEEVIGTSLLLTVAACAFGEFSIFGFSVRNIVSILVVLVLGWKNGILIGATSGVTIGVVTAIIGGGQPLMIASYAFSGMIAGVFNKLGKIGVVAGFILGNAIIAYTSTGNVEPIIYLQEILIASLGLLLVPNSVRIDIEEIIPKRKCLPISNERTLEKSKETIYRLNNVSEAISEIAKTYQEAAATVVEEMTEETEEEIKNRNLFIEDLKNALQGQEENILYEDLTEPEQGIVQDIFAFLRQGRELNRQDLLDIFESYNNYIVGFEDEQTNKPMEEDINQALKIIKETYKINQLNYVWKKKMKESRKTMSTQLDNVSKAISSLAENMDKEDTQMQKYQKEKEEIKKILLQKGIKIKEAEIKQQKTGRYQIKVYMENCLDQQCKTDIIEEVLTKVLKENIELYKEECGIKLQNAICILHYLSKDNYKMQIGMGKATKDKSVVSGDSSMHIRLEDGKYLLVLSDGMGSGPEARKSSKIAIKMLQRLLTAGFDKEVSLELINSSICLNAEDETYATLDIAIVDLYTGNIEFIKNGACPTYIKNNKDVQMIKTLSLPAGILDNIDLTVYDKDIENNDILVMCTDGILESNTEYQNKELWVKYLLEDMETQSVQKIADIMITESIDNGYGIAKDDMTVMAIKITK